MLAQSSDVEVRDFRQILIWPLSVRYIEANGQSNTSGRRPGLDKTDDKSLQPLLDKLTSDFTEKGWKWSDEAAITRSLINQPEYDEEQDYSEMVYFHSFVRDFLYGGDGHVPSSRPMRVLRRTDVAAWTVTIKHQPSVRLDVDRTELYLFETGVAILVVELSLPDSTPLTLDRVLKLQSVARMVFPRRWKDGTPSEAPLEISLLGHDDKGVLATQDFRKKDYFTTPVREQAELPTAAHLVHLLDPLPFYGTARGDGRAGYCLDHVEDQRIPSMTYVAVDDPRQISDWDHARLAFFDGSGDSMVGAYSHDFETDWQRKYCYDRFWQREPSEGDRPKVAAHNEMMQTRWLCSGYGFSVIGRWGDRTYCGQIKANFRHHYFKMGLIAQFHRASLLVLRDELAKTTKLTDDRNPENTAKLKEKTFHERVIDLKERAIRFRSRFWFREVSTQLQGQELFRWWSDLLGNQELFDHTMGDIDAAETLVRTQQEEVENRHSRNLNVVAGGAAGFGLVITFFALVTSIVALQCIRLGVPQAEWSRAVAGDVLWKSVVAGICVLIVVGAIGTGLVWAIDRLVGTRVISALRRKRTK